jgi:hypothetical protein
MKKALVSAALVWNRRRHVCLAQAQPAPKPRRRSGGNGGSGRQATAARAATVVAPNPADAAKHQAWSSSTASAATTAARRSPRTIPVNLETAKLDDLLPQRRRGSACSAN